MKAKIYLGEIDPSRRLHELGLTREMLAQVVDSGLSRAVECTEYHPPSYPGWVMYGELTAELRQILVPLGWILSDTQNRSVIKNPKAHISVCVASGDENTGRAGSDSEPITNSPKGILTQEAVKVNKRLQHYLFKEMEPPEEPEYESWVLLHHRDVKANEVRSELSRPIGMDQEGHLTKWAERIILEILPMGGNSVGGQEGSHGSEGSKIEIDIKRRNAG